MWPESADLDPQNIIGTSESDQEKTETHSREDTWKCTRIEDTLDSREDTWKCTRIEDTLNSREDTWKCTRIEDTLKTFVFLLWLWYLEDYDYI